MGTGKIIGEIAFFAGGVRMANVKGSQGGFIAFITTKHLKQLFVVAPSTGAKMVHALGLSSLYQLTHNPREHPALAWNMTGTVEAEMEAQRWQTSYFGATQLVIAMMSRRS